jgi:anti-sigma B factor antagonist
MQTPEFHIHVADDGALLTLALTGELDLNTVDKVQEALAAHHSGRQALVIDLSGLTFMDSSGINLMVNLWNRRDGTAVAFVAPGDEVARALEISGVKELLTWVADPADALGDIRQ